MIVLFLGLAVFQKIRWRQQRLKLQQLAQQNPKALSTIAQRLNIGQLDIQAIIQGNYEIRGKKFYQLEAAVDEYLKAERKG
ncbi:hypothetical protein [Bombilactobacillus bombi]|uniref:hypothetical protein n=1 Tax=Bombilactobacillus bombi TaxID=1303590 RepID=UPI0015E5FDB4|nr:hypothetical protein [Bombilactobacillus bombi]MBA1435232.1 hypothetical protein [Bombilactobacillus bombi]